MELEEKYKDLIELYSKSEKRNDEFEPSLYSYKKHKFRNGLEFDDFEIKKKKRNKNEMSRRL